jgi:hypothetical protein
MPFASEAQRRWMHVHEPAMARRWEKETPKGKDLPQHVAHQAGGAVAQAEPGGGPPHHDEPTLAFLASL